MMLLRSKSARCGMSTVIVLGLVFFFFSYSLLSAQIADKALPEQDLSLSLIWTADSKRGKQVLFSAFKDKKWTIPVLLTESKQQVYHAAVSSGDDGKIWAVWIREEAGGSFPQWSVYRSTGWSQPRRVVTGLDRNKAVSVIVDSANVPWIAWSGVDKKYPDIFWSRWNGEAWESAARAHAINEVPDLDPSLGLDGSGHVVLSWQTFVDGRYVTVSKNWDGQGWRTDFSSSMQAKMKNNLHERTRKITLPDFIKDPGQASLFIKGQDGAVSISVMDL